MAETDAGQGKRTTIPGLDPGDPLSTVDLIRLGSRNAVATVPRLLARYWWAAVLVLALWIGLGTFDVYRLGMKYPSLIPLWVFIDRFARILIFLTAAYNNFIAKGVYAAVIVRVGIPLARRIKGEGMSKVAADFRGLLPGLKANWERAEGYALGILIGSAGVGMIVSNFLTRNNKIDKIAVSLALAMALLKALSDGHRSLPFMSSRVISKDLFLLTGRESPVRNHHIYVGISGMAVGLLCCLPLAVLAGISGYIGYILGIIALVAGCGLLLAGKGMGARR